MTDKIIAAYIRISQEDRDLKANQSKEESSSVGNQRKYIRDYLRKHSFPQDRVQEFVDDGYSGTNFNRPKFREMLDLCKQGKVACIIVKDFSRFGRNYVELGDYIEQLFPFLGLRFISINDQYDSNCLNGVTGGIDVAFQNLIYEMYSRDLSQKTYSSVGIRMKKGVYLPGAAPFGYNIERKAFSTIDFECGRAADGNKNDRLQKTLTPDGEAAEIVKRIFSEVAGGKSTVQVAKEFNWEGIPLPLEYKKKKGEFLNRDYAEFPQWTRQKLLRIIQNEKYIGTMIYRSHKTITIGSGIRKKQEESNWIRIENHHEPIVTREIFEKANANLKKIKNTGQRASGEKKKKLFICGHCRHRLTWRDSKRTSLKCRNAYGGKDKNCSKIFVIADEVYQLINEKIEEQKQIFQDSSAASAKPNTETKAVCREKRQEQIRTEVKSLEEKSLQIYESYKSGITNKVGFMELKQTLEKEKQCLEQHKTVLPESDFMSTGHNPISEAGIQKWVKEIIVYADKRIDIIWQEGY